jgi:hypothetical protein
LGPQQADFASGAQHDAFFSGAQQGSVAPGFWVVGSVSVVAVSFRLDIEGSFWPGFPALPP